MTTTPQIIEDFVNTEYKVGIMKTNHKKTLTFGELIESVYSACSHRRARAIVRFAVNAQVVVFRGQRRFVIS